MLYKDLLKRYFYINLKYFITLIKNVDSLLVIIYKCLSFKIY